MSPYHVTKYFIRNDRQGCGMLEWLQIQIYTIAFDSPHVQRSAFFHTDHETKIITFNL